MGYTTRFSGSFRIDRELDETTKLILEQLHDRRHDDYEWIGLPGIWCHWRVGSDNQSLEWDQGEKFYEYEKWLAYIVNFVLVPAGYGLEGSVLYQGERVGDCGRITVDNESIRVEKGWEV